MEDDILKMLNEELEKEQARINQTPLEDFDFLSPEDMFNLVHRPFQEESPIQFKKNINNSVLDQIPFLNLVEYLLVKVKSENSIKLTQKGNLPTKIVKELYSLKLIQEEMIESGISKLYKESDSLSITNAKIVIELSGLVKKRNNKISLTRKGIKLIKPENRNELLKELFQTYGFKFNLGYHDLYEDEGQVQICLSYTLYQILMNGDKKRKTEFYTKKMLIAYPHILGFFKDRSYSTPEEQFHNCYEARFMERFLNWFNIVEFNEESRLESSYVKSVLSKEIFQINKENLKYRKQEFFA